MISRLRRENRRDNLNSKEINQSCAHNNDRDDSYLEAQTRTFFFDRSHLRNTSSDPLAEANSFPLDSGLEGAVTDHDCKMKMR